MNRRLHAVAAIAAGALLLGGCGSDTDTGNDDRGTRGADNSAAEAAADWTLGNLTDAGLLEITTSYEGKTNTFVDHGSSVDLALALNALDHAPERVEEITDALADDLATYVGTDGEVYAGPSAKALALVAEQGRDARDFGGEDLQARVEGTVTSRGPAAGRISDASQYGDYANTLGQAYAAGALTRVGSEKADAATEFLLAQQCEEGFFRLDLSKPKAKDQSCDGADVDAEQAPDVTALVVLQLAPVADQHEGVGEALDAAGEWLLEQQADDGTFSDPQNGTNANTVGLAGWALRVLGEDEAADRAAAWLAARQIGEEEEGELADEVGAIAYDTLGLEDGRRYGITDPLDRSQWVLAAVQAFPALAQALTVTGQG
ncbi:hypothetical protein IEQ44_10430 [Nocardioides sp. Y6]|uniref:Terpene cyclase/mutase family protein n=1 Tax=Nocardioides malaquae TaxID=2773426 RepID=A0ABR9RU30_9ACTN|nr:hypothetical protein [Nocardioides malaquae]MBE7325075.1 hypothetical protein [Nocardioides malaquae]